MFRPSRCSDVSDITGASEMLGGRVKTLHPAVHGGKHSGKEGNVLFNDTLNTFYLRLYGYGPF